LKPAAGGEANTGREFKRAMKAMGLWTLPIWIFLATTGVGVLSWLRRPGMADLYASLVHFTGNGGSLLMGLYAVCALLFIGKAFRTWRSHGPSVATWHCLLVICWFVIPVAIILAITILKPVFLARYLIVAQPGLVLMAAAGIASLERVRLMAPLAAVIAGLGFGGIRSYYEQDFDIVRADYRSAAEFIVTHAAPGDALLFHQANARYAYDYYAGRHAGPEPRPMIVAPGHGDPPVWRDFMAQVKDPVLEAVTRDYARVWVLLSNNTGPQGEDARSGEIRSALERRYRLVEERRFAGIRLCLYAP
jgi:mannosyltransferase